MLMWSLLMLVGLRSPAVSKKRAAISGLVPKSCWGSSLFEVERIFVASVGALRLWHDQTEGSPVYVAASLHHAIAHGEILAIALTSGEASTRVFLCVRGGKRSIHELNGSLSRCPPQHSFAVVGFVHLSFAAHPLILGHFSRSATLSRSGRRGSGNG